MTITEAIEKYLNFVERHRRAKRKTISGYRTQLRHFRDAMRYLEDTTEPVNVTLDMVTRHIERRRETGDAVRSINQQLTVVRQFFVYLVDEGVILKSPAKRARALAVEPRDPTEGAPTDEDLARARGRTTDPVEAFILEVLSTTGLRAGELAGLRIEDVNMAERVIQNRRSKTPAGKRPVFLTRRAAELLSGILQSPVSGLQPDSRILPFGRTKLDEAVRRIFGRVGLSHRAHALRRYVLTRMLTAGMDLPFAQILIGHATKKNMGVTGLYLRPQMRTLRAAWARVFESGLQPAQSKEAV